mmetsp:Transcript_119450/g.343120  ORF Transcript_119450/g.343120 Transcript_119450/m.343120 type:complete len:257 (-) Transcript_119450:55-825(-)
MAARKPPPAPAPGGVGGALGWLALSGEPLWLRIISTKPWKSMPPLPPATSNSSTETIPSASWSSTRKALLKSLSESVRGRSTVAAKNSEYSSPLGSCNSRPMSKLCMSMPAFAIPEANSSRDKRPSRSVSNASKASRRSQIFPSLTSLTRIRSAAFFILLCCRKSLIRSKTEASNRAWGARREAADPDMAEGLIGCQPATWLSPDQGPNQVVRILADLRPCLAMEPPCPCADEVADLGFVAFERRLAAQQHVHDDT